MSVLMAGEPTPGRVETDAGRYRVRRWNRAGEPVLSVEAEPGSPLPPYGERRSIRRRLRASAAGRVVLFTDAARLSGVWSWFEREESGPLAYRERGWDPARPMVVPARGEGGRRGQEWRGAPRARRATRSALVKLLRREIDGMANPHPECADPGQLLQDLVERTESADAVRRLWRAVTRLRVLDAACGTGDWLIGAGEAISVVHLACMERMDCLLADAGRSGVPARRTKLRDLRTILARADDTRRWPTRRRYARELALCQNLRGADGDARAVAETRGRLECWVRGGEAGGRGAPLLPMIVRVGRVMVPEGGRERERPASEREESVTRAAEQLRRSWLEERSDEAAVSAAAGMIAGELDVLTGADGRLEAWSAYREVMRAGGFHLIRRAPR
jgi:hypothetical protein